ncbi:MAG TPA: energy-coupling factor transporter transmembrane component T [Patescibacteria group bacterium]|nr:energy-coupling factor transporter transmembrane component T [Patescibacteria group bacterium]
MLSWQDVSGVGVHSTMLHRLDPRVKILMLLTTGLLVVFIDNPWVLGGLLSMGLTGMAAARLEAVKIKVVSTVIILGLWGAVFSQALFYEQTPRTAIFTLISPGFPLLGPLTKGLYVYQEGMVYGLRQGLRMAVMTSLGMLVCWTTDTRLLLLGLVRLRLPYSLAFMAVTAVRFIPVLMQETMQVMAASRLRGGSRFSLQVLSPILANCLRRAGTLAVAVESRAFRAYNRRVYLEELHMAMGEKLLLVSYMLMATAVAFTKISYLGYTYGIYYHFSLRPLYEIARSCL